MKAIIQSVLLAGLAAGSATADVVFDVFGKKHTFVMQGSSSAPYPGTLNSSFDGYPSSSINGSKRLYVRIPSDRRWGWSGGTIETPKIPENRLTYPVVYDPWRASQFDRTPIQGILTNMRAPVLMIEVPAKAKALTVELDLELLGNLAGIPSAPNDARVTANCFAGFLAYGPDASNYRNRKVEQMVAPTVRLSAPNTAGTGHSIGWFTFAAFADMLPYSYPGNTGAIQSYLPTLTPFLYSADVSTAGSSTFNLQWFSSAYPDPKRYKKVYTITVPAAWGGAATLVAIEFAPYMVRTWEDKTSGGNKGDLIYYAPTGGTVKISSQSEPTGTVTVTNKLMEGYKGNIAVQFSVK